MTEDSSTHSLEQTVVDDGAKVVEVTEEVESLSIQPPIATPPKKQAIVVYEGDERWQGGKAPPTPLSDDDEDYDHSLSPEDPDDPGQLLADYPDDAEEIELLHSRISSARSLNLPRFAKSLKSLCLRQNALTEVDSADFGPLTALEELDIYDNQVKDLGDALKDMKNLRVLDVSFNLLRSVPPVIASLTSLRTVYFVQNKISHIDGLEAVGKTLTSLELGGNRIRTIENLDALVNLEELWLGKNKISKLENLRSLKKLKILSIQSNRITKLEGLEELTDLEEIYLSHNGVQRLEGLENNLKLKTIDVGNNQIPELENVSHLAALEELWINDNQIPDLRGLTPQLGSLSSLRTIYLEGNPCQKNDHVGYRRKVILALPQVTQVDATYVR